MCSLSRWRLVLFVAIGVIAASAQDAETEWSEKTLAGARAVVAGDLPAAEKAYQSALRLARGFGDKDPRLAGSLKSLGALYLKRRHYPKAKPLLEEAARITEAALGPDHETTTEIWSNLAAFYLETGKPAAALYYFDKAIRNQEQQFGKDDPRLVEVLTGLARCARDLGYLPEMDHVARRALEILKKKDPGHSLAKQPVFEMVDNAYSAQFRRLASRSDVKASRRKLTLFDWLASIHADYGDPADGERRARELLQFREKQAGSGSPSQVPVLTYLAEALRRQGRLQEATEALDRAVRLTQEGDCIDESATIWLLRKKVSLLEQTGNTEKAERIRQRIAAIVLDTYGGKRGASPASDGNSQPPTLRKRVEPSYSREAAELGYEAMVALSIVVTAKGRVKDPYVLRCAGHGLDKQALKAVRKWRFEPATKDGKPVEVLSATELKFRLP